MDPIAYLERLTQHLIALQETAAGGPYCVVEQVEAAALALAAAGLMEPAAVTEARSAAEDAMEAAGLVTSVHYELDVVAGVGVAGGPRPAAPRTDPRWEFGDVWGLGTSMGEDDAHRQLILLSLSSWNLGFAVSYALVGPLSGRKTRDSEWSAWDDVGMHYMAHGHGSRGGDGLLRGEVMFAPALSSGATKLTLQRKGGHTLTTEISLNPPSS